MEAHNAARDFANEVLDGTEGDVPRIGIALEGPDHSKIDADTWDALVKTSQGIAGRRPPILHLGGRATTLIFDVPRGNRRDAYALLYNVHRNLAPLGICPRIILDVEVRYEG